MPTLRVWIKKTVPGPNGTIEIGLGGTHEVSCEPHQVARERLALYQSYREEVERLIACELNGTPVAPPSPEHQRQPTEPEPESTPTSRERSRQVLAELQERLAQRARAREPMPHGLLEALHDPAPGHALEDLLGKSPTEREEEP